MAVGGDGAAIGSARERARARARETERARWGEGVWVWRTRGRRRAEAARARRMAAGGGPEGCRQGCRVPRRCLTRKNDRPAGRQAVSVAIVGSCAHGVYIVCARRETAPPHVSASQRRVYRCDDDRRILLQRCQAASSLELPAHVLQLLLERRARGASLNPIPWRCRASATESSSSWAAATAASSATARTSSSSRSPKSSSSSATSRSSRLRAAGSTPLQSARPDRSGRGAATMIRPSDGPEPKTSRFS